MRETNCPICYTQLIVKDVTPCMECGANDLELNHYKEHDYNEYELYFRQRLIFCDFCNYDFGSYDPTYFGFPKGSNIGIEQWNFVREIKDKELRKDKYCPVCQHRLPFLRFIVQCREENKGK